MIEKVNPMHPDKIADRIAGAIVDLAYKFNEIPKIAVEVLIGHNNCTVIQEGSTEYVSRENVDEIVRRIAENDNISLNYIAVPQDGELARNQEGTIRCGDNGIFRGVPLTDEEYNLSYIARMIYAKYLSDGKYILNGQKLIVCQSNATNEELSGMLNIINAEKVINPLGRWEGGINTDSGATNRKLGSDMGHGITGGGLHGKDLSKADVSVNIYAFLKAQETKEEVNICCAIGDETVDGIPYEMIVNIAREFINKLGGFERFAEWGLF